MIFGRSGKGLARNDRALLVCSLTYFLQNLRLYTPIRVASQSAHNHRLLMPFWSAGLVWIKVRPAIKHTFRLPLADRIDWVYFHT